MKSGVNVIVLEGGVVKNPELKYTPEGLAITRFSVANSAVSKRNGQASEEVSYFDISCFGKLAEICANYLKKGSQIILSGRLTQNRWKTTEGTNRSMVKIVASDVKFLPARNKNNGQRFAGNYPNKNTQSA